MFLTVPGATPEQLKAGLAAAQAFLDSKGVTMAQVIEAEMLYEQWVEGCMGPDDMPPEEGEQIRQVFKEAGRIAIDAACPELVGAAYRRGVYQLEAYETGPTVWPEQAQ